MTTKTYRKEADSIGEKQVPANALYGINSLRALENFPYYTPFDLEWYKAMGEVKLAVYMTYKKFLDSLHEQFPNKQIPLDLIPVDKIDAMIEAAKEVAEGKYFDQFIVPSISGGAGTSINMNVNEIIANLALQKLNKPLGDYSYIDPIESANVYQSTNDVVPTSLKVALIRLLKELENSINNLRHTVEYLENKHRNDLRLGFTQMQIAVPSSFGNLFSAYNAALSRDWWRISKAIDTIKSVNLGGSAIGTAMGVPLFMVMEMAETLQKNTALPINRATNLSDATSNLDAYIEVHGMLKAHAGNLEKMVNDLRLLASDVVGANAVKIPPRQVGSSIMPGKINPVIPEFVISVSHSVYAHDTLVSSLSAQGCLDLNAYLPVIGHNIIESIKMLTAANNTANEHLISGLEIDPEVDKNKVYKSKSISTVMNPFIGYKKSSEYAKMMQKEKCNIFEANEKLKIMDKERLSFILKPENLLKTGFTIAELVEDKK